MPEMKRVLFVTSSHRVGLTGQLTEQALAFTRGGRGEFLFLCGEREQFPGLFAQLREAAVPYAVIRGFDDHAELGRLVREFLEHLRRFGPDSVTVHTNWQLAVAAAAKMISGGKWQLVYIIHGYRHNYPLRSFIARYLIGTGLMLFADAVIAPSGFLRRKFSVLSRRVHVIPIGEDEALFAEGSLPDFSVRRRLIFAGEFRDGKNQEMIIQALKWYVERTGDRDVELCLPGAGPRLERCVTLSKALGLERNVLFPGFLNREEMLRNYLLSQFAVVPSNVETFGHCVVEPLILGRVVLTRPVGVALDVIEHGKNGFIFQNVEELAELLVSVLPDPDLCRAVAQRARESRDVFRWDRVCNAHFELIYDRPRQQ